MARTDSRYVARLTVQGNADPPRRLMEEALEQLLRQRGEEALVTIEFDAAESEIPDRSGSDPYTLDLRMCDDHGMVSRGPVMRTDEPMIPDATKDRSYIDRHNRLAGPTKPNGDPRPGYPIKEPFQCTGHAHYAGEHIRCTSPAHA